MRAYAQVAALAACAAAVPMDKRQVFSPPVAFSTTAAAPASSVVADSSVMSILPVTSAAASGTGCSVSYMTPSATPSSASCTQTITLSPSVSSVAAPIGAVANSSVPVGSSAAPSSPAASGVAGTPGSSTGGLNEAFVAKGKLYLGNIADPGTLSSSADILISDFGQITPENSMKWDATEPSQGAFSFDSADQTAAWAIENGKILRCHALLWHSQLPTWVSSISDPTELTSVIQNHIAEVAGHFAGQCSHWDVINEMFNEDGTIRESVFSNVLGEDFVRIAFEAAREADPNAKLYINDYNLDDASYPKVTGLTSKVSEWIAAGIPIDGIGTQSHLSSGHTGTEELLNTLVATGVSEVAVTELDIGNGSGADYVEVVGACANVPECVGVTVWGVTDDQSWRAGEAATLYDGSFQPKEAYTTLLEYLQSS